MASSSKIKVVLLAFEWGSKRGGLSTFNRELAIELAKHPEVQVSVFLPRCDHEEQNAAVSKNVTLVQEKRRPGVDEETHWLNFPPNDLQMDFVIRHGVVLGRQAQIIRESRQCKWIQFAYTDPEELGTFKDYLCRGRFCPGRGAKAGRSLSVLSSLLRERPKGICPHARHF